MTVGQRIALKRKELGLSQEALGEHLGVSRQSIYKWESDTVLPEVDKLIALSRLFSVSVGWLLGVEDAQPEPSPELTPEQLAMVKEIVVQYLSALPTPPTIRKRPWIWAGTGLLVALAAFFLILFGQLSQANANHRSLQSSIQTVQHAVNTQINSIADRVERILQSQNELTAEHHTSHLSNDLTANTASFAVYAVPKTYQPGMTAVFQARSGGKVTELTVEQPDGDNAFSGTLSCPLTDDITLSVVFRTGETEQTQLLDTYTGLYTATFPDLSVYLSSASSVFSPSGDHIRLSAAQWEFSSSSPDNTYWKELLEKGSIQVGIFRDRELLVWYQTAMHEDLPRNSAALSNSPYWFLPEALVLEPGSDYVQAAVYTDADGRQCVFPGSGWYWDETSRDWTRYSFSPEPGQPSAWTY